MATTIEEFIEQGQDDPMSYHGFAISENDNQLTFPIDNIIYDYIDEIRSFAVELGLKPIEFSRYIYKPWLFAHDVYNNSELAFIILALNNMASPKEFDKSVIYALKTDDMETLLTQIYNSEEDYLIKMRNRLE